MHLRAVFLLMGVSILLVTSRVPVTGAMQLRGCDESTVAAADDPFAVVVVCEKTAREVLDDPGKARAYLVLGRLYVRLPDLVSERFRVAAAVLSSEGRRRYEQSVKESSAARRRFVRFAKARASLYSYDEISGSYNYNGYHFKAIGESYPGTDVVDDAAYELARLSQGGECEGSLDCYLERGVLPLVAFLRVHPRSELCAAAVAAINAHMRDSYEVWVMRFGQPANPKLPSEFYEPGRIATTLRQYEDAARHLDASTRAEVHLGAAEMWVHLGERAEAVRLYEGTLKEIPGHRVAQRRLEEVSR
jgi:hypothetical protein